MQAVVYCLRKIPLAVVGSGNNVHKVSMSADSYVFSGKGWGHGVGMSRKVKVLPAGYTYDQIWYYFTGISVNKALGF